MIQRIQSVYLVVGALCLVPLAFFGVIGTTQAAETLAWYASVVTIVGTATVTVAVGAVFMYKNRPKQLKLVTALQVMTIIFMVIVYGGLFLADDLDRLGNPEGDVSQLVILLLPIVSYIFFYLARRGIQHDIDLVKSMDRLR